MLEMRSWRITLAMEEAVLLFISKGTRRARLRGEY
jgi:hypothetical protein